MVTGDSAQCAGYVAKACGMLEESADLLLADVNTTGNVAWSFVGSHAQDSKLQTKMTTAQASGAGLVLTRDWSSCPNFHDTLCQTMLYAGFCLIVSRLALVMAFSGPVNAMLSARTVSGCAFSLLACCTPQLMLEC